MKQMFLRGWLTVGLVVTLGGTAWTFQRSKPPKYDEHEMRRRYEACLPALDFVSLASEQPKLIQDLMSGNPEWQRAAVKTLGESRDLRAVPWMVWLLDSEERILQTMTGVSIYRVISSFPVEQPEDSRPDAAAARSPVNPKTDIRPFAWVVLKMIRNPCTEGYAIFLSEHMKLAEFEDELRKFLYSRQPGASHAARGALQKLGFEVGKDEGFKRQLPPDTPSTPTPAKKQAFVGGTGPDTTDTDGDGLPDGMETALGTEPGNPDSDGDGLPDGWEVVNGLDPLSASGDDGADGDPDGDGIRNSRELRLGTSALNTDSDCDGLEDGEEAGGVMVADIPWFGLSEGGDITSLFGDQDSSCVTVPLIAPVTIRDTVFTNLTLDVNGLVYLSPSGYQNNANPENRNRDMTDWTVRRKGVTLAPFWSNLIAVTNAEPASRVISGSASDGTTSYHVIEYRDMRVNAWPVSTNDRVTFQLAIPLGETDRVFVRYGLAAGTADGRNASVGFQWLGGKQRDSWCHNEAGRIQAGLSLAFTVGIGTDPTRVDTDGDGLADGTEIALRSVYPCLNPLSIDSDGDMLSDDWEIQYGLDPCSRADKTLLASDDDKDGLGLFDEFRYGTDPGNPDTDGDGVSDGDEVRPRAISGRNPGKAGGLAESIAAVSHMGKQRHAHIGQVLKQRQGFWVVQVKPLYIRVEL